MVIAELLANFLPGKVKTRGGHLLSALLMALIVGLVTAGLGHFYGRDWGTALTWGAALAAVVAAGYALAYPFMRNRLTGEG